MTTAQDRRSLDRTACPQRVAYCMRALGKSGLPESLVLGGVQYRLTRSVKHDFFAATGFYDDVRGRRVVLKLGRTEEFAGAPLLWLGQWLRDRELRFYARLKDVHQVPKMLGTLGPTGFVLEFVDGQPLSRAGDIPDGFFDKLQDLLAEVHRRGMAYVDSNKTQNILVGCDGLPHLIDFQISYALDEHGRGWLHRQFLQHLQRADVYHILKHKRRLRPDEMTADEIRVVDRLTPLLRIHRFIVKPYFKLRRRTFQRLRQSGRLLPEGSK